MSKDDDYLFTPSLLMSKKEVDEMFPMYYALFPVGIEDIVKHELEKVAPPIHITWQSPLPNKQLLQREGYSFKGAQSMQNFEIINNVEPYLLVGGALYFTLHNGKEHRYIATVEETSLFLERARCVRCVELLGLHISSFSCAGGLGCADRELAPATGLMRKAVVEHLSALRMARAAHKHALVGFDGDFYISGITDGKVLFRVNCVRRDKTIPCAFTSQELASRVGEVIYDAFEPLGWRVNMLYHNVEFFVVHKGEHAYLGLILTPPALPRGGYEMCFTEQLGLEFLRQRIGNAILEGYDSESLRAAVPRPSSFSKDIRLTKGKNAMNPALASALCRYCGVRSGEVIVDPFLGSGATLLEAWIASGFAPLVALGGDFCRDDSMLSWRNLQPDALFLATVNGLLTSRITEAEGGFEIKELCRELLSVMKEYVESMPLPFRWDTKQNGGSALNPSYPVAAPVTAEHITHKLKKCLERHYQLSLLTVQWDAARLPIRSESVDCIVSDLPFGRRCGNHKVNVKLYPLMLMECHRILRGCVGNSIDSSTVEMENDESYLLHASDDANKGPWWNVSYMGNRRCRGRAVLLTIEGKLMMESLEEVRSKCPFHLLHPPFKVEMGGLFPYVFVLERV